jgi:hypothetical protein
MQNLRRGHYELAVDALPTMRVAARVVPTARAAGSSYQAKTWLLTAYAT